METVWQERYWEGLGPFPCENSRGKDYNSEKFNNGFVKQFSREEEFPWELQNLVDFEKRQRFLFIFFVFKSLHLPLRAYNTPQNPPRVSRFSLLLGFIMILLFLLLCVASCYSTEYLLLQSYSQPLCHSADLVAAAVFNVSANCQEDGAHKWLKYECKGSIGGQIECSDKNCQKCNSNFKPFPQGCQLKERDTSVHIFCSNEGNPYKGSNLSYFYNTIRHGTTCSGFDILASYQTSDVCVTGTEFFCKTKTIVNCDSKDLQCSGSSCDKSPLTKSCFKYDESSSIEVGYECLNSAQI